MRVYVYIYIIGKDVLVFSCVIEQPDARSIFHRKKYFLFDEVIHLFIWRCFWHQDGFGGHSYFEKIIHDDHPNCVPCVRSVYMSSQSWTCIQNKHWATVHDNTHENGNNRSWNILLCTWIELSSSVQFRSNLGLLIWVNIRIQNAKREKVIHFFRYTRLFAHG